MVFLCHYDVMRSDTVLRSTLHVMFTLDLTAFVGKRRASARPISSPLPAKASHFLESPTPDAKYQCRKLQSISPVSKHRSNTMILTWDPLMRHRGQRRTLTPHCPCPAMNRPVGQGTDCGVICQPWTAKRPFPHKASCTILYDPARYLLGKSHDLAACI